MMLWMGIFLTLVFLLKEKGYFVVVFNFSGNRLFISSPYDWWQGSNWGTQVHLIGMEQGGDPEC